MNEHKSTAPDFFLNLGVVVTLYAVVISFLNLTFDIVNKLFPENAAYGYYDTYSSGVRLSIACLIIIFPLFLWLSRTITKAIQEDPSRREVGVRRWLVYITLFLSASTVVTDLVILLNTFLNGEISTRFILKVLAVLVVGGLVFWHYLSEVRGTSSAQKYIITMYGSSFCIVALIVYAFVVFGSPATIRKLRTDDIRIQHLQSIQYQILNYREQKGVLPSKLSDLNDSLSGFSVPVDPETGAEYVFSTKGPLSFKLCADFSLETPSGSNTDTSYEYTMRGIQGGSWKHTSGDSCFDRTIDPELYPILKK